MENLKKSNCLIEALLLRLSNRGSTFGFDFNSPRGTISFYCIIGEDRYRFRRKMRVHSNKNKYYFVGYRVVEKLTNS